MEILIEITIHDIITKMNYTIHDMIENNNNKMIWFKK